MPTIRSILISAALTDDDSVYYNCNNLLTKYPVCLNGNLSLVDVSRFDIQLNT